jgi:hypothetical protein
VCLRAGILPLTSSIIHLSKILQNIIPFTNVLVIVKPVTYNQFYNTNYYRSMKYLLTAAIVCLSTFCFAQATVPRSNKLPHSNIVEKYSVLKSDKKVKQGWYTATLNDIDVVTGFYLNGERAGIWNFYSNEGKLIRTYNYTVNQLTYLDSADTRASRRYLTEVIPADMGDKQVKNGGNATPQR